ncbi:MAG: hypothetical protein ACAI25_05470 [Planctomycetota bacterium]
MPEPDETGGDPDRDPDELKDDEEPPAPPPLGPAFIVGGVKGAAGGALVLAILGPLAVSFGRGLSAGMNGTTPPPLGLKDLIEMLSMLLSGILGGAVLCGFDAAARRLRARPRASIAYGVAGGLLAPLAIGSPYYALSSASHGTLTGEQVLLFLLAMTAFAAGQIAAGPPTELAHRPQGCLRLVRAGSATPFVLVVGLLVFSGKSGGFGPLVAAVVMGVIMAGIFWLGQIFVSPLTRRLAAWLEPDAPP